MRTLFRPKAPHILSAVLLCLLGVAPMRAQVLAQRNWEGSGVTVEPWWRRAVFYRIDPETFQDSDGDGKGDLAGVAQRLDYLQSLGVDALILQSGSEGDPLPVDGFDDLARAAVGHHVRVLVELGAPASQSGDAQYVAAARAWLNQGAAGLYVPTRELEKVDGAGHIVQLLHQLRALTDSFPGARVLLADAPEKPDDDLVKALAKETQLTASPAIIVAPVPGGAMPLVASLRAQLAIVAGNTAASAQTAPIRRGRRHAGTSGETNPLLLAARIPDAADGVDKAGLERAIAVILLASRSAVVLEYGQELGLAAAKTREPLMQWTTSNVTRKPEPPPAPETSKPAEPSSDYQGFQAYIPPLPKNLFPPPKMPVVVESDEPVAIDPNTLPGFTAGTLDAALAAANGATANVATEQDDPKSLLNLYRQLIQLHHDNATVRNGAETVLDYDAENALVWVRRTPANSRTSANVVVACNLSDKPVTLGDVGTLHVRGLRSLLSAEPGGDLLTVAPGAVLVGEVR
jgi:hypothetical protein